MAIDLTQRQRRWLDALLILATIAAAFVVIDFVAGVIYGFGDILLIFFLAWLLAFILSPIVGFLVSHIPYLNRIAAVVIVYTLLLGAIVAIVVLVANAMARSITDFIANVPNLRSQLPDLLAPWQQRLEDLGFGQVAQALPGQAQVFIDNLNDYAEQLAGPLQQLAVASLGALGNVILVLVLSLYMVADRDRILAFLFRIVPPALKEEARLLEASVGRSFGGMLRATAVTALVYAAVAVVTSAVLGLDYLPITAAASGFLMAIPFFGPFVSWMPPVLVAVLTKPDATIPAIVCMGVGWFVVMNVLVPRLMADAVGIHPIVVLASVLVGGKVAGVTGAIFGIPIAAVLSAFFFHYLGRSHDTRSVAHRAADRLEAREGRPIRVPREPAPGFDTDVEPEPPPAAPRPRGASANQAHPIADTSPPASDPGRPPATAQ
jgi:predicted PurR-regulated permease PerM